MRNHLMAVHLGAPAGTHLPLPSKWNGQIGPVCSRVICLEPTLTDPFTSEIASGNHDLCGVLMAQMMPSYGVYEAARATYAPGAQI